MALIQGTIRSRRLRLSTDPAIMSVFSLRAISSSSSEAVSEQGTFKTRRLRVLFQELGCYMEFKSYFGCLQPWKLFLPAFATFHCGSYICPSIYKKYFSKEDFLERISRECQILYSGGSSSCEILISYPHDKKSFSFSLEVISSGF